MVEVTKNGIIKNVTKSAFEDYLRSQGWEMVGEVKHSPSPKKIKDVESEPEKVEEVNVENTNSDEEINDEDWDEAMDELVDEEIEKPISEMNKEELIAKAKSLNINTTGLSNKQLREAIKSSK